ncbi:MAG: L-threonylcarbamoyladenylate synthase [Saprospiraceae bacterium]|mgnify:FL=1|nr:L-threonylcarbamoyladenylate synthase [Saprospiraceae bacterium]|tara:strand:- start:1798 stop:2370 length:573 start_codon:yes stop_codon:yes gene_type:complete
MTIDYFDELEVINNTLTSGGIILYPTDTIWGIGCDVFQLEAVEKIYNIKKRPRELPFVLLVSSIEMLKTYANIHPRLETLMVYHKKPLTLIYEEVDSLPESILSEDGTIAMRVANDPFCQLIIEELGSPLVSTSANLSGQQFPKHFDEVTGDILRHMDYIVQHRQDDKEERLPSVMAEFNKKGELLFIRE